MQTPKRALVVMLALAAVPLSSASADACTRTWVAASGSWDSAASWSPAGVPGPADDVCLTGAGTYTVTLSATAGGAHVRSLTLGGGDGVQTLWIDGESLDGVTDTLLHVTNGLLRFDAGTTFRNDGSILVDDGGSLVLISAPSVGWAPTQMINTGTIAANGLVQLELGLWTQAGGSASTFKGVQIVNGSLDYRSGTGAFVLSEPLGGSATGTLSGTIPPDQLVVLRGGVFGTPNALPWTVRLTGAEFVNRGTLQLDGDADAPDAPGGPVVLGGAPLRNLGKVDVFETGYHEPFAAPAYLRTDIANEPGAEFDIYGLAVQDGGSSFVNHGTFTMNDGSYSLEGSPPDAATTFTNAADGAFEFLRAGKPSVVQIRPGGTLVAGGVLRPEKRLSPGVAQGHELRLFTIANGTLVGRFPRVQGGFGADYSQRGFIGVVYGTRVEKVVGGRGSLSVRLSCAHDRLACRTAVVQASVQGVQVATASGAIPSGQARTLELTLNRKGRRLLAQAPGALVVQVVVLSDRTTIATRSVRVHRL